MSKEVGGRENMWFSHKGYDNYIYCKRMAAMVKKDAEEVLEYFQKTKKYNTSSFLFNAT